MSSATPPSPTARSSPRARPATSGAIEQASDGGALRLAETAAGHLGAMEASVADHGVALAGQAAGELGALEQSAVGHAEALAGEAVEQGGRPRGRGRRPR